MSKVFCLTRSKPQKCALLIWLFTHHIIRAITILIRRLRRGVGILLCYCMDIKNHSISSHRYNIICEYQLPRLYYMAFSNIYNSMYNKDKENYFTKEVIMMSKFLSSFTVIAIMLKNRKKSKNCWYKWRHDTSGLVCIMRSCGRTLKKELGGEKMERGGTERVTTEIIESMVCATRWAFWDMTETANPADSRE